MAVHPAIENREQAMWLRASSHTTHTSLGKVQTIHKCDRSPIPAPDPC